MKIPTTTTCTCGGKMNLIITKPVQVLKYECEKCHLRYVDHGNSGEWYRHKICPECEGEMKIEQNYFTYNYEWVCQKCRHKMKYSSIYLCEK